MRVRRKRGGGGKSPTETAELEKGMEGEMKLHNWVEGSNNTAL
jgi:hypothetical protein